MEASPQKALTVCKENQRIDTGNRRLTATHTVLLEGLSLHGYCISFAFCWIVYMKEVVQLYRLLEVGLYIVSMHLYICTSWMKSWNLCHNVDILSSLSNKGVSRKSFTAAAAVPSLWDANNKRSSKTIRYPVLKSGKKSHCLNSQFTPLPFGRLRSNVLLDSLRLGLRQVVLLLQKQYCVQR